MSNLTVFDVEVIKKLIEDGYYVKNRRFHGIKVPTLPDHKVVLKFSEKFNPFNIYRDNEINAVFNSESYKILCPKDFSNYEKFIYIVRKSMPDPYNEISCKVKIRSELLKNKVDFRYNRIFRREGITVDFYMKNLNLALDIGKDVGIMDKESIFKKKGIVYKVYRPNEWKKLIKELPLCMMLQSC